MDENERRTNTRVAFQTLADIIFPDHRYQQCHTRNVSLTGIFIIGPQGRKIGEQCEAVVHLTGGASDISVTVKGLVSRITDEGIGLKFNEIDLDSFQHLKNIVYYNAENPDDVNDEFLDTLKGHPQG
ncbi:PilZ domain-containing protein [Thermodesulfobacteriota bacterium]